MTAFLGQIERLLERAFEVPSQRLFRTRLQPVELARALGRAMVAEAQVGAGGLQVPNEYVVELHPGDFRRFGGARAGLERDLAAYVLQQAQRRGWRCPGWPEVALAEADDVRPGRPRVSARTIDRPLASGPEPAPSPPLAGTAVLPAMLERQRRATARTSQAWLVLADGRRVALGDGALRIGRALDNDLVFDHDSVSRHHAEVRRDGGRYVIVDLGSTNGTRVDGQPVSEHPLWPGALIEVGGVAMRLRVTG
jgi:hypothetical protein